MIRSYRALLWFLLVPYFAVRSLNVLPWIGESRDSANRTNAQLTVALIFASSILGILGFTGAYQGLRDMPPILIGLLCFVPPMIAITVLFDRDREKRYWTAYKAMPVQQRSMFGAATLIFVLVMLWLAISNPA